jgi:hypothetical protein
LDFPRLLLGSLARADSAPGAGGGRWSSAMLRTCRSALPQPSPASRAQARRDGGWRARSGARAGHGRCRPGTRQTDCSRLPAKCTHHLPVRVKNLLKTGRDGVSRVQRGGQPSASKTAIGSR